MPNIIWLSIAIGFTLGGVWYYETKEIVGAMVTWLVISVISFVVFFLMCTVSMIYPEKVVYEQWTQNPIYSLKEMNGGINGSFLLGSGSLNSTWYYVAYIHTEDGFYKEKYNQNTSYIKETDEVKPFVKKFVTATHHNSFIEFMIGWDVSSSYGYTKYILYVPKGTIIKEFRLE